MENTIESDTTSGPDGPGRNYAAGAIFVLLLVSYLVNAMDRQVFPVLLVAVRNDYGFSTTEAGLQSTIFALGIGVLGLPSGYLIDRVSRKWTVFAGTVIFSAATGLTTLSFGLWDMTLWRVLSGVGESMQFTALIAIAATAFPARRGMAIGTINICFALGALIGPTLGGALLTRTGQWRLPEIVFAVLGGIVAVAIAVFAGPWLTERRAQAQNGHRVVGGADTLLNRNTVLLIVMTVIGGLVDFGFLGMYGTFMQTALHYTAAQAGLVAGISGAGALLSFYGGHLGDRLSPRIVLPASFALTGVAGAAVFLGPANMVWQVVFALLFGIAFSAAAFVLLAGFLVKSVDARRAGLTAGIFVTSIYIPAAFAGLLFSSLAQSWSWGAAALVQIVLGSAVATVLALLLRPSRFSTVLPAQTSVTAGA